MTKSKTTPKEKGSKHAERPTVTAAHPNLQPGTWLVSKVYDYWKLKIIGAESWPFYKCWIPETESEGNYHAGYLVKDYEVER
jgi:hypothetical protein